MQPSVYVSYRTVVFRLYIFDLVRAFGLHYNTDAIFFETVAGLYDYIFFALTAFNIILPLGSITSCNFSLISMESAARQVFIQSFSTYVGFVLL